MSRFLEVKTPLEKDVLLLHKMQAAEELSRLSKYRLKLLSEQGDIDLAELLGKKISVELQLANDETRQFNGYVTRIAQGGVRGRYHVYTATVRPWLWFLTRTTNCRIFQDKTIPDILKEIFDLHSGIADVKFELTESYAPWTYCVQYRETDFDFVSRLMEHEGMYYFFKHADGKHTLVIADSYSAHSPIVDEEIQYIPPGRAGRPEEEHINEWSISRSLQPGKYALTDYDFEKPSVNLEVKSNIKRDHALADYEIYDYPGDYDERKSGEQYARTRIEELQAKYERVSAATNVRSMAPGYLFKLTSHPRSDQNTEYLALAAEYTIKSAEYEAADKTGNSYHCRFTALNSRQPFRAERITEKPVMQGPQTALVVGPSGEEIYTDKFGRVKVHFFWDRYDKRDENSSCWIRVSQNWGGKGWGGMFIPHVGQEVIVTFLEGDPDSPLITGRVYNAENMPPAELPANKTKSIISDHGGNHITLQGGSGGQQIKMFSPTGNTTFAIGAPGSPGDGIEGVTDLFFKMTVGQDWKVQISGNEYTLVTKEEKKEVMANSIKLIRANATEMVWGNKDSMIKGYKTESIMGWDRKAILGFSWSFIAGTKTEVVGGLDTKINLVNKNDVIAGLNVKITKGGLCDFNSAKVLKKRPTVFENVFEQVIRETKEKKEAADFALKVTGIMAETIENLNQKIGKLDSKVDGLSKIVAGTMHLESKGAFDIVASKVEFSEEVIVNGDLTVGGDAFLFGENVLAAKK